MIFCRASADADHDQPSNADDCATTAATSARICARNAGVYAALFAPLKLLGRL